MTHRPWRWIRCLASVWLLATGMILLLSSESFAFYDVRPYARITFGGDDSLPVAGGALKGKVWFYTPQGLTLATRSGNTYAATVSYRLPLEFTLDGECECTRDGLLMSGVRDLNPFAHDADLRIEIRGWSEIKGIKIEFENRSGLGAVGGILQLGGLGEEWYHIYNVAGKTISEELHSAPYKNVRAVVLRGMEYNNAEMIVVDPAVGDNYPKPNRVGIIRFHCYGYDEYLIKSIDLLS